MVSTSTSHLQPVSSLAVDPTSNFFLSGSADSMIHVWSLPSLLSFSPDTSRSPIHTLSTHRGAITSLVCGHSSSNANIAISTSQDKSAIIWDYQNGQALRTYLLPEVPTAATIDPADRAFYATYDDASWQLIDFYDESQKSTSIDLLRDASSSHRPMQPPAKARFSADSQKLGGALSLSLSWDGTCLITGHASGKIALWDIAKGNYLSTLANLPGPVTNLQFLAPTGFPNVPEPKFKLPTVVKPKQELGTQNTANGVVPPNYSLHMQFTGRLDVSAISATTEKSMSEKSEFEKALTHPSFPTYMLEESLAELETWNVQSKGQGAPAVDFVAFDQDMGGDADSKGGSAGGAQEDEVKALKKQLASLQRIQKVTFKQVSELREEKEYFLAKERKRSKRKQTKAKKKLGLANGNASAENEDVEMSNGSEEDGSSESESGSSDAATSDGSEEGSDGEDDSDDGSE